MPGADGHGHAAAVTGSVTLATNARIGVAAAGDVLTISGVIGGAGGLTKVGAGTLALTRANTYSGDTGISAGTLRVAAGNVIPDGAGKGNVVVEGTLDLNGWSEAINGLSGSGIIDNTAAGTASLGVGMNDQGGTFSGTIQDTGGDLTVNKLSTGTLTLGGSNSYNGATTIDSGGTLVITHANALGRTGSGTTVSATPRWPSTASRPPTADHSRPGRGQRGRLLGIGTAAVPAR